MIHFISSPKLHLYKVLPQEKPSLVKISDMNEQLKYDCLLYSSNYSGIKETTHSPQQRRKRPSNFLEEKYTVTIFMY